MRRSQAARYAQWSAGIALVLATTTAVVYLQRKWSQHQDRKNAPPAAPVNVQRQSNGLTFSKVEGNRKIFTLTASQSTDFRDKDTTLLESVHITIFGKTGDRNDVINTQSCQYDKSSGSIACSGDVRMDLQSAADAQRVAADPSQAPQVVHVETSQVTFDRGTGLARTSQPVTLEFPSGTGHGVGVEYQSDRGSVRLLSDVQFNLKSPQSPTGKNSIHPEIAKEVRIQGSSLDFDRPTRRMLLHGPTEAETDAARLTSGEGLLELDQAFRAQVFRAGPGTGGKRPELELRASDGASDLTSDSLVAIFSPQGWVTRVEATGNVVGSRQTPTEQEDMSAVTAVLDLWPLASQPRQIDLNGSVLLKTQSRQSAESRTLRTNALQVHFSESGEGRASKLQLAQTLAPGTLEWTEAVAGAAAAVAHTRLTADSLELQFASTGKPGQLVASGNMSTERTFPGRPVQTATARTGTAQLLPSGGWSQIDLQHDVILREPDRNARAERVVFLHDPATAALTGKAVVRDATTETVAPRIVFHQETGDISAEGRVRSTDLSAQGRSLNFDPAPANVIADAMQANSKTGHVLYSGHARLWQGDSVLEADSIELIRPSRELVARNHVRAVFPQAAAPTAGLPSGGGTQAKTNLWHVTSALLTYWDAENRARAERDVVAQSAAQKTRSAVMDLYFTRNGSPSSIDGPQQIERGVATGGVTVEEGLRKAVAERGEYTAADGKFVMSGGTPTIFDGSAGATTGRQLTFFLASDTIIVDSENGSRTLTKHRVDR
jgi:LPS export ABC transporter protein LptC